MDERGESTLNTVTAQAPTGPTFVVRAYDETNPSTKKNSDQCGERVKQLAPAPVLSRAQLEAGYEQIAKQVQCLRGAGFDMGVTTSFDDFAANSGNVDASSRYAELRASGNAFGDAEWHCAALYPIPPVG